MATAKKNSLWFRALVALTFPVWFPLAVVATVVLGVVAHVLMETEDRI